MTPVRRTFVASLMAAALVAAVVSPVVIAQQDKPAPPAKVAGKWQTVLEMEVGNANITLEFTQDGEKLAGTYAGRYGKYPLAGTVKGRVLEFVVTINAEGTETRMTFTGELEAKDQVIKGSANLGGMGDAGWIAKRASEVP